MAFDQSTRNRLQKFVAESRAILTEEFTRQLQSTYGMDPKTGTIADPETLTFLDNQGQQTALILGETLTHYLTTIPGKSQKTRTCQALDRIIREQAFTVLNRLSALRMAGARGFLIESIANGYSSKGFQLYKNLAGTALGKTEQTVTGDTYRQYLFSLFDEFSGELPVLFDRYSVQGRLFPRESALLALLEQINHFEIEHLWAEDETIGWIYQYFNSKEERKTMRDESSAPRNSRELAVRNQFFTPRYVVEFLTDNTLGRIWYEMTQGKTSLVGTCRYLARRPNEIFLTKGEDAPDTDVEAHESLSQEELLKQPVYIPFRELKDPRELRMLDPACGSMHFGLYAFDLFERIYEEAWQLESELGGDAFDRPEEMASLQAIYSGFDEFKKSIPKLIIEHNIHGVDIDPRAVQIAGLSLWQRAHRSWHQMGIKPGDRPMIRKSNIVCAEPMPGDKEILKEFTSKLHPPVLGQLVETIFDKMELAGEAGTLLKIEEEIASAIGMAKDEFNKEILKSKEEKGFLPGMAPKRQPTLFDFAELPDDTNFWDTAEKRILDALENYADQAESNDAQKRLFAEDAAKGFAFIDLCRKRFDVVLMNPPFGEASGLSKKYLANHFFYWSKNILCCFIGRAKSFLTETGFYAAIFDRTVAIKSSYENFRKEVLINNIHCVADTGWNVLDANVETTSYVLRKNSSLNTNSIFFDLRDVEPLHKEETLLSNVNNVNDVGDKSPIYLVRNNDLITLPNSVIGYYFDEYTKHCFKNFKSLQEVNLQSRKGHDYISFRHFRLFWERDLSVDLNNSNFVRVYNGGKYSAFTDPLRNIVLFGEDANLIKHHKSVYIRNSNYHFQPGVGFGKRGEIIDAHYLPSGFSFTSEGLACTKIEKQKSLFMLGYLNSSVGQYLLNTYSGQHKQVGYVNILPVPDIDGHLTKRLVSLVKAAISKKFFWYSIDETTPFFKFQKSYTMISEFLSYDSVEFFEKDRAEYKAILNEIDSIFEQSINIKLPTDLINLKNNRPEDNPWFEGLSTNSVIELRAFSTFYLASLILGVAFDRWDSQIIPHNFNIDFEPLVDSLAIEFNKVKNAGKRILNFDNCSIEQFLLYLPQSEQFVYNSKDFSKKIEEILSITGKDSIEELFSDGTFFDFHLNQFNKSRREAPIYWSLQTSSCSYTLWVYYHRLNGQTLYTCVNDFVEPKLKNVTNDLNNLLKKSARNTTEEKILAKLADLEAELKDFRDELLRIAKFWKPNLNDGVQITAAPLWKLFQHRQWQKKLKATWEKLENGDYDWAHLACSIWPERVLKKCHSDRSLAIAHDVENDFWEEVEVPVIRRGKNTGKTKWEWQPRKLSETQLQDLIRQIIETGHTAG